MNERELAYLIHEMGPVQLALLRALSKEEQTVVELMARIGAQEGWQPSRWQIHESMARLTRRNFVRSYKRRKKTKTRGVRVCRVWFLSEVGVLASRGAWNKERTRENAQHTR